MDLAELDSPLHPVVYLHSWTSDLVPSYVQTPTNIDALGTPNNPVARLEHQLHYFRSFTQKRLFTRHYVDFDSDNELTAYLEPTLWDIEGWSYTDRIPRRLHADNVIQRRLELERLQQRPPTPIGPRTPSAVPFFATTPYVQSPLFDSGLPLEPDLQAIIDEPPASNSPAPGTVAVPPPAPPADPDSSESSNSSHHTPSSSRSPSPVMATPTPADIMNILGALAARITDLTANIADMQQAQVDRLNAPAPPRAPLPKAPENFTGKEKESLRVETFIAEVKDYVIQARFTTDREKSLFLLSCLVEDATLWSNQQRSTWPQDIIQGDTEPDADFLNREQQLQRERAAHPTSNFLTLCNLFTTNFKNMKTREELLIDLKYYYMKDDDSLVEYKTRLEYLFALARWNKDENSSLFHAYEHLSRRIKHNWNASTAPRDAADTFEELFANARIVEAHLYAESKRRPAVSSVDTGRKSLAERFTAAPSAPPPSVASSHIKPSRGQPKVRCTRCFYNSHTADACRTNLTTPKYAQYRKEHPEFGAFTPPAPALSAITGTHNSFEVPCVSSDEEQASTVVTKKRKTPTIAALATVKRKKTTFEDLDQELEVLSRKARPLEPRRSNGKDETSVSCTLEGSHRLSTHSTLAPQLATGSSDASKDLLPTKGLAALSLLPWAGNVEQEDTTMQGTSLTKTLEMDTDPNTTQTAMKTSSTTDLSEEPMTGLTSKSDTPKPLYHTRKAKAPLPAQYTSSLYVSNAYTQRLAIRVIIELDGIEIAAKALIDCGATNNFMDKQFIEEFSIPTTPVALVQEISLADGEGGSDSHITHDVRETVNINGLRMTIGFSATKLGRHKIILGMPWLASKVRPVPNFVKRTVTFMQPQLAAFQSISAKIASENKKETVPVTELVPKHYHEFLAIFSELEAAKLPPHREHDCEITLNERYKPFEGYRGKRTEVERLEIDETVKDLLSKGHIRPSKSPVWSPVTFVKKKDGTNRMCIDFRKLNDYTVRDQHPIPITQEAVNEFKGSTIFSALDLRSSYHLLRIKEGDEWKTAFKANDGFYEYTVMPFGLCNAPAQFQRWMNSIFRDLLHKGVVVYLDDIMMHSQTIEEHIILVSEVLRRLREHNLYCKPEKCAFHKKKIEYLGLVISEEGIETDQKKLTAIQEWKPLESVKQVQSFLGFCNFYRRFMPNYSHHAKPLTILTQKDTRFVWGSEQVKAFEKIKLALTTSPVLAYPNMKKMFVLETDCSDYAMGAVLQQYHCICGNHTDDLSECKRKKLRPIGYFSRTLSPEQVNYIIYDKELLAIVEALKYFSEYLRQNPVKTLIYSDHKMLEYFLKTKILTQREARWVLELSEYFFEIHYKKGTDNLKADALSRKPGDKPKEGGEIPQSVLKIEHFAECSLITSDGTLLKEIATAQANDKTVKDLVALLQSNSVPAEMQRATQDFRIEAELLTYRHLIYVPDNNELKRKILESRHDSKTAGHNGIEKTTELVTREFYWRSLKQYVQHYISGCDLCQRTKPKTEILRAPLNPLGVPLKPWESITYDLITGLPDNQGFDSILVVVDRLTKMAHFIECHTTLDAMGTAKLFIKHIWSKHGLPAHAVSDRGTQFAATFMRNLYNLLGIDMALSTAYHPQTDGQTERVNQNLEQYLRLYCDQRQTNWVELLPFAEFAYNNTEHSSTGVSPFKANFGYHPAMNGTALRNPPGESGELATTIRTVQTELRSHLLLAQERQKLFYDKYSRTLPNFNEGDEVWLKNEDFVTDRPSKKLDHKWLGPFKILTKHSDVAYKLQLPPTMKIHPVFNICKLAAYIDDEVEGRQQERPGPVRIEPDGEHFEIIRILNSRYRNKVLEYKLEWAGYDIGDDAWQKANTLEDADHLIKEFHEAHPSAAGPALKQGATTAQPPRVKKAPAKRKKQQT